MHLKSAAKTLHLLGNFDDPHGGAELSLLDLAKILEQHAPEWRVQFWAVQAPHLFYSQLLGSRLQTVSAFGGRFPVGGVLVIGGVHVHLGPWLAHCRADRVILSYNIPNNDLLFKCVLIVQNATQKQPDIVFVSEMQKLSVGLPGVVQSAPLQLDMFVRIERLRKDAQAPICIGRLSRDSLPKHSPLDPALYRSVAARGLRVRVMGGRCLAPMLQEFPDVELMEAGAESSPIFLQSLDIFFYRNGAQTEAFGRVVFEAMASGLPVIAAVHGGYAEHITQGQEGFLVNSQEEAFEAISLLSRDTALRHRMGRAARIKVQAMYVPEQYRSMARYYTNDA